MKIFQNQSKSTYTAVKVLKQANGMMSKKLRKQVIEKMAEPAKKNI